MDQLLAKLLSASGVSGCEKEVSLLMQEYFKKSSQNVQIDNFGNVIAVKGSGKTKIMLAAHMDEIGLMAKYIDNSGFIYFIKIGGFDDRILPGQRVVIKSKKGDITGIIGTRPAHLQKEEEKKSPLKHEDMFIDIGAKNKDDALGKVSLGDQIIFEPNCGCLGEDIYYGKAVDDRVGCYILLKAFERINPRCQVYAVATAQEEVGLKGARTSSFRIDPDYAIAIDTTIAGDTPQVKENETELKLGEGVAITLIEASGRGIIVSEKMKELLVNTAKDKNIKYQMSILDAGMTDGAMIYMNREGVVTGVLSVPTRYVHAPSAVFSLKDVNCAIELVVAAVEAIG
ncbi:MAG: M42 family metallopeptidase [Candidatus Omnitrophica bacterium]|jgi:endoglucanase|nr:M42 family metallopeptidase [Candidatus Omnitrophota bacterium]